MNAVSAGGETLPAIDVLVPHYEAVDALALTLASIDAQAYGGRLRVVVADDGSSPETLARLHGLLDARERPVVVLENGVNRGRPYTRNVLLDATESPFTAWLDAGDEWYPRKTALQVEKALALGGAESAAPFWITCNFDWKWSGNEASQRRQAVDQDQVMGLLRGKDLRAYLWTILGPTRTFRDVGWFDEKLPRLQDLDFFLRFLIKGGMLHMPATDESLCVYHKSDI
ncbi:MAG: glycosyltransferase family 2 protein, partial [Bauldia sp.]|nr:glycosyltransferase family 2 protein [Bauldia sp.]